jgi:hypothetical protein
MLVPARSVICSEFMPLPGTAALTQSPVAVDEGGRGLKMPPSLPRKTGWKAVSTPMSLMSA